MTSYASLLGCGGSWQTSMLGGSFNELREKRYAWGLTQPLGMITDPIDDNMYVAERTTGVIKRIPREGGYSRFSEPFLAGFSEPSCIRFTPDGTREYVCDRAMDTGYRR